MNAHGSAHAGNHTQSFISFDRNDDRDDLCYFGVIGIGIGRRQQRKGGRSGKSDLIYFASQCGVWKSIDIYIDDLTRFNFINRSLVHIGRHVQVIEIIGPCKWRTGRY